MLLREVENNPNPGGGFGKLVEMARRSGGAEGSPIWHLFAYKPEWTVHLERFTHEVMRGASPLSPGWRELIAAFTSKLNQCPF
ncbi:MAG: peroxidase [Acidimicrobiia bacterium]|nr:peroxidase [Acidimicrobiia bacterium]